ncbi:PspC domain-containing protein, partial [Staphylococcus aureus]|nr:PspC domain-containing protein [Staphylococcus aureus]
EFLGIDATLLRLIYIIITIITMKTGIAIIAYIVALFVIPSSDTSNEEVLERHRRRVEEKRNRHAGRNQARQEVRGAMRNSH